MKVDCSLRLISVCWATSWRSFSKLCHVKD